MTKPLHSTTWRTESDCGVLVDVAEGRTTEWAPFREIVVTMDAGMTPAEARRLIADLQHAIALAEEATSEDEDDSEESPVVVIPENPIQRANRQNRAACYAQGRFDADPIRYVPSAQFIALVTERGIDTEGFRSLYNELLAVKTAVSADQPKPRTPRVFPKGSPEPEGVEALTDEAGFRWNRAAQANPSQHYWRRAGWGLMGRPTLWTALNRRQALSEVLADSEQVTR